MAPHDAKVTTAPAAAPFAAGRYLGLALLVIATAQLMLVLDDTIVNVALPSIQRSLHLATSHLNWVSSFYALAFGGLLLAGGRAGDLFGRLWVFRLGIIVFALASLAGGFAPTGTALVIARVVQGCGAALAAPGGLSLLATTFPAGPARTRALGVYGAMGGLGSVVGLLLGGALTTYLSWRWVLFINVPIAGLVLAGSGVLVPGDREHGALDVAGAATATLGIGSLIYALTRGNTNGWTDPGTLACFAAGAVLLAAFVLIERGSRAPMLPARVVRDRNRAGANTVLLLLGTGMFAMFYLLTLYLQVVRGYSAMRTGLAALPFVAGVILASAGLGPRLLGALPARAVIAAGMTLCSGGLAWYVVALTPASNYFAVMLPAMLAGGIGTGLTFIGCTVTGMRAVASHDTGIAAGLLNTSVQTGAALGLAALAAIASIVTRNRLPGHTTAAALTDGYLAGLLAGSIIFAAGALVALFTINARISPAATGHRAEDAKARR
ncbi:MAG TPA: MFS transporter [Streptosporangiaceae bacterium]|jgi:EmrB/QacA subfamily drug resistance transporter|nr:MFS transporter [Streptosporangiaceae bacterium]